MFEDLLGRLVSGALWGAGAGVVMSAMRGGTGLRPVTRAFMQAYVVASDKVREVTSEARESVEDLYAEAKAERRNGRASKTALVVPATASASSRRTSGTSGSRSASRSSTSRPRPSRAASRTTARSATPAAGEGVSTNSTNATATAAE